MIISIHQPNFFPWLGLFSKINLSDYFVILTEAHRSKGDKYLSRATILNNGKIVYLSIPLGKSQVEIKDLKLPKSNTWRVKFKNFIDESYRKAPFFREYQNDVADLIYADYDNFAEYSINIIKYFVKQFKFNTNIIIDTDFHTNLGTSNTRNLRICKELNADIYFSGLGAKSYNDEKLFLNNGIDLIYQNFNVIHYAQSSDKFIGGLSVLDAMFNLGIERTRDLILDGQNKV